MLDKTWNLLEKGPWLSGSDHRLGHLLDLRQEEESGLLPTSEGAVEEAIPIDP